MSLSPQAKKEICRLWYGNPEQFLLGYEMESRKNEGDEVSPIIAQATRHNEGKPDLHYLDPWYDALCAVAKVCMRGEKKYARGNYLKGQPHSQLLGCAKRHEMKFGSYKYSDYDEESGEHHLAHAIWNLLQLLQNDLDPATKERFDDRLRPPE